MTDEVKVDETANFVSTTSDAPAIDSEIEEVKIEETKTDENQEGEPKAKEETKTSDDVTTGDDATADETKPKGKGGFQKRIDKAVREREDAKRKAESLEKRNQELERRLADKKAPKETEPKEPKEGDFETYDEYLDALDVFDKAKDSSSEEQKPETQKKTETDVPKADTLSDSQRTAMAVIKEKVHDAAEKYSDFEKVALAEDVSITGEMLEALAECEDPAKVMYHLGQNKDLAQQIADSSPVQQMREITRLDISANVKPPKPVKKTSAPDPITPVSGSDVQQKPVSEMSFSEYEAHQNKIEQESGAVW